MLLEIDQVSALITRILKHLCDQEDMLVYKSPERKKEGKKGRRSRLLRTKNGSESFILVENTFFFSPPASLHHSNYHNATTTWHNNRNNWSALQPNFTSSLYSVLSQFQMNKVKSNLIYSNLTYKSFPWISTWASPCCRAPC